MAGVRTEQREYRKARRRAPPKSKGKELQLCVEICIEEDLPDDPEILVLHTEILWFFLFIFNLSVLETELIGS